MPSKRAARCTEIAGNDAGGGDVAGGRGGEEEASIGDAGDNGEVVDPIGLDLLLQR